MAKVEENYKYLADALSLNLWKEDKSYVIYGNKEDYEVLIYSADKRYPYMLTVSIAASNTSGAAVSKEESKNFAKNNKMVMSLRQDGNQFIMSMKNIGNQNKLAEEMKSCLSELISFLQDKGYENCCQFCGQNVDTEPYLIGEGMLHLCPDCIEKTLKDKTLSEIQTREKSENVVAGIVGAFLGSVLGVLCILLFSQMGRVAVISGIIMAACALKGYELLAGKLTKKGIVFSAVIIVLMVYIGDRIDWAILITREFGSYYDIDFLNAFQLVPEFLAEEVIEAGSYWGNLALLYIFTLGGAIPMIINAVKDNKDKGRILRISSGADASADSSQNSF